MERLFWFVLLHLVFRCFLWFLGFFCVSFFFVRRLVHLVHRFVRGLVSLGKGKGRHRNRESKGEQQREYFLHIWQLLLNVPIYTRTPGDCDVMVPGPAEL